MLNLSAAFDSADRCIRPTQDIQFCWFRSRPDVIVPPWKAVAYLGFRKRGAKFSLATSAHTKEGTNQVFQFFQCQKKNFLPKGGHGLMVPLNTPLLEGSNT